VTEPVTGTVRVAGSKSVTNRALVLATLSHSTTQLTGALVARDTHLMIAGLRKLGAEVEVNGRRRVTLDRWGTASSASCLP
jgi:3-phosphoshikimate 1-carboxyvinyltransferase